MNSKVDWFFNKATKWQKEYQVLRDIVLETNLQEDLKWGCPCYTFNHDNIVLIHGFKDYCALLFHKGVLLKDAQKLLIQQTPNVQSARQLRFTSTQEIHKLKKAIQSLIKNAIAVEKKGLKVELKKTEDVEVPKEFQSLLKDMPALKKAFYGLTPGRQRAYLFYFSSAKQVKTREARIEKYLDKILDGKGLDD